MKLDLSKRITIFVGILVLLISLSIGLISIKVSSNSVIKEVEEAMIRYAEEGAKHIETRINISLVSLYEVANRERTRSMDLQIQKESMTGRCREIRLFRFGSGNARWDGTLCFR